MNFENFGHIDSVSNFNHFGDLKQLFKMLSTQREVIAYTVGKIGNNFLDYLQYSDLLKIFCCIATKETLGNNTEQKFSHFLPILPLEMLMHMKDTALIVVAAPVSRHAEIRENLTEYGFSEVIILDQEIHSQIKAELKKLNDSGQVANWFMNHVVKKLREMEYRIAEQNEISAVHTETFGKYQNAFRGKKIVLVANGPTLNYYTPIPDAIHIGVNRAYYREDINFDYYFIGDRHPIMEDREDITLGFSRIHGRLFLGQPTLRSPLSQPRWFPEQHFLEYENISRFYFNTYGLYKEDIPLYRDICHHLLTGFASIATWALRFALWTYPEKIYLVGCDTTSEGHFYDSDDLPQTFGLGNIHRVKVGYARIKMFARLHYPETEIISVNPVGLKGLFTDTYTDGYLAAQVPSTAGGGVRVAA